MTVTQTGGSTRGRLLPGSLYVEITAKPLPSVQALPSSILDLLSTAEGIAHPSSCWLSVDQWLLPYMFSPYHKAFVMTGVPIVSVTGAAVSAAPQLPRPQLNLIKFHYIDLASFWATKV